MGCLLKRFRIFDLSNVSITNDGYFDGIFNFDLFGNEYDCIDYDYLLLEICYDADCDGTLNSDDCAPEDASISTANNMYDPWNDAYR